MARKGSSGKAYILQSPKYMVCHEPYTGLRPLRHMKCNAHHYCEDCFCLAVGLAIAEETSHPVPCGKNAGPRLELEDVRATLLRCITIPTSQRDDLLQRYADRLLLYNIPDRTQCSKEACPRFLPVNTFGFQNGQRVRCPDCNTVTCTACKAGVNPTDIAGRTCSPEAFVLSKSKTTSTSKAMVAPTDGSQRLSSGPRRASGRS